VLFNHRNGHYVIINKLEWAWLDDASVTLCTGRCCRGCTW
jgi:hypothetical protein